MMTIICGTPSLNNYEKSTSSNFKLIAVYKAFKAMKMCTTHDHNTWQEGSLQLMRIKQDGWCKIYLIIQNSTITFHTLMTQCSANGPQLMRGYFSCTRTALGLTVWIDLTSKADTSILIVCSYIRKYKLVLLSVLMTCRFIKAFRCLSTTRQVGILQLLVSRALKHGISFPYDGISFGALSPSCVFHITKSRVSNVSQVPTSCAIL